MSRELDISSILANAVDLDSVASSLEFEAGSLRREASRLDSLASLVRTRVLAIRAAAQ